MSDQDNPTTPVGYESRWVPTSPSDPWGARVLVVAPHPDDESLGCGGTIAIHAKRGDTVRILFLTDGAEGDAERKYARAAYVELREAEARRACSILGVTDLEFWRMPDRGSRADESSIERMQRAIGDHRPDVIYAPSFFEFHPDHIAAARIVWEAVRRLRTPARIAFYEINHPFRINTLVDVTPLIPTKRAACNEYKSQLERIPYTEIAISLNRFRSLTVAVSCEHAEGFFVVDASDIAAFPLESYALRQMTMRDDVVASDTNPLVSIIVRTKDRPHLLREALWSIVAQDYEAIEVVLVQDGGASVADIAEEFASRLQLTLHANATSAGRSAAANQGLARATGKYVMYLDDDDVLYGNHVSTLARHLESTGRSVAYSDCRLMKFARGSAVPYEVQSPYLGVEFDRELLMEENYIPFITVMFRKELAVACGGFDESLDMFEDWDMWIRMSKEVDFVRIPVVTADYRIYDEREYDVNGGRLRIYEKNSDYWTFERLYASSWARIDRLKSQNDKLVEAIRSRAPERIARRLRRAWATLKDGS